MNYQDVVSNVKVYGFEDSVKGAKYSYATDINKVSDEVTKTTESLACSPAGSGHDQFMTGIVVQFDLTFSNIVALSCAREPQQRPMPKGQL